MASGLEQQLLAEARAALTTGSSRQPPLLPVIATATATSTATSTATARVTGPSGRLPSRLPVEQTAVACVGAALEAAAALHRQRGGECDAVGVDRGHVAAAFQSERRFVVTGRPAGPLFDPMSRFWPAADGWVRTHANYPWHRAALLEALGTPDDVDAVAAALARLPVGDIEERVFGAGGIAAAVRTVDAWRAHPQGLALAAEPLIGHDIAGVAAPRNRPAGDLPASGVRILDLTRVIAGPVCTRFLAALGADVLRLDPPRRPDMPLGTAADGLLGKRSALLDLDAAAGGAGISTLHRLLDQSDAVVCGYRPGALERFGLGAGPLAERHPGLVIVYLDAWGHTGPWSGRRGFDSVVQAPTGIAAAVAAAESGAEAAPGVLPCQLLDHATGYLTAAAVLDGLRRQGAEGATHVRRLSLARTALWLTSTAVKEPTGEPGEGPDPSPSQWLVELDSAEGPVAAVAPPGTLDERSLRWPFPVTGYGNDPPSWPRAR